MKLSWWKALGGFFLATLLSLTAFAADTNTALPGTLNFIEGQASIQTQPLTTKSVGTAELQPGQTLTTENGRAEVLLTPGVFLRLDRNSAVKMISPGLTNTEIQLDRGKAFVEVAEIHKQNNLVVKQDDTTTKMVKTGLYGFSAEPDAVQVYKGEARVTDGDQQVKVKGGRELDLNATGKLKAEKFDKDQAENTDFYAWSKLRSEYLSEASANAAQVYVANGWTGPGWYWDPWYSGFTFVPGAGIAYSPFGWGFYSPTYLYGVGFGYGIPVYRGVYHRPWVGVHRPPIAGVHVSPHPPAGMRPGGFHGGIARPGGNHIGARVGGVHR
jgi:hypothetical protein